MSATMLRSSQRQRAALGETLREFANLAAATLGLAQFLGDRPPSWSMLVAGAVIWLILVVYALRLLAGDD
jgi:hypothetical protein